MPLFSWSDLVLEARVEMLKKNFVGFMVEIMPPKSPFEIDWPLWFSLISASGFNHQQIHKTLQKSCINPMLVGQAVCVGYVVHFGQSLYI